MTIVNVSKNAKCPLYGEYKNRSLSIDAIIQSRGKILLIKRGNDPYKGYWAIPGGHVDFDETVEVTVKREVKEETGLTVTKLTLFGIYSDPGRHPRQTIALAYEVEVKDEKPIAGDDATELAWFSPDQLPDNLAFDHKLILQNFISDYKFRNHSRFKWYLPILYLLTLAVLLILRVTPLNNASGQTCLGVCIGPIDSILLLYVVLPGYQNQAIVDFFIPESVTDSLYSYLPDYVNHDLFTTIVFGVLIYLVVLFVLGFVIDLVIKRLMKRKYNLIKTE